MGKPNKKMFPGFPTKRKQCNKCFKVYRSVTHFRHITNGFSRRIFFSTVIRRPWLSMHFQVQGLGYVLQIENGIIHDLDFLHFCVTFYDNGSIMNI